MNKKRLYLWERRLSDYEALQAECDKLRAELEECIGEGGYDGSKDYGDKTGFDGSKDYSDKTGYDGSKGAKS